MSNIEIGKNNGDFGGFYIVSSNSSYALHSLKENQAKTKISFSKGHTILRAAPLSTMWLRTIVQYCVAVVSVLLSVESELP